MLVYALMMAVILLYVCAWLDGFKSFCSLIFIMLITNHEDMPSSVGEILHVWPSNCEKKFVMMTSELNKNRPLKA